MNKCGVVQLRNLGRASFAAAALGLVVLCSGSSAQALTPVAATDTAWMGATVAQAMSPRDGSALDRIIQNQTGSQPAAAPQVMASLAVSPAPTVWAAPVASAAPAPSPAPAPPVRAAAATQAPDIFGSVAFAAASTGFQARWRHAASGRSPSADDWTLAVNRAAGAAPLERLQQVNAWVNQALRFESDASVYGVSDYWASPDESISRGRGDCEDYAIAKMRLLTAAGISPGSLYLMIVKDLIRRQDHAVLAVRLGGQFWVLDNATDLVLPADKVDGYRPVVTYSAGRTWVHGYSRTPDLMLAASGPLAPAGPTARP